MFQNELSRRRRELDRKTDGAIAEALAECGRRAGALAMGAVKTHVRLLRSGDPRVAQRSASEILNRAGVEGSDGSGDSTRPSGVAADESGLDLLKAALRQSAAHQR